jgi:hypothetical protein
MNFKAGMIVLLLKLCCEMAGRNTRNNSNDDQKEISDLLTKNQLENSALKKLLDFLNKKLVVQTRNNDKPRQVKY